MLERFQRGDPGGATVVREQTVAESRPPAERISLRAIRARQREEYGGVNWGAAFFGLRHAARRCGGRQGRRALPPPGRSRRISG
jgi:hypothetical protein